MSQGQGDGTMGAKFMLQEHGRIIDAYYDLHVQKNELLRVYLTFVSLPATIVAIFLSIYKYLQPAVTLGGAGGILQSAGFYLSFLLVLIGISVLQVLLSIRTEQLLYVKTINGTRQYFKEKWEIDEAYLILPSDSRYISFASKEPGGRAFWESMIVGFTNSAFIAFLAFEVANHLRIGADCSSALAVGVVCISILGHVIFIRSRLKIAIEKLKVVDRGF